MHLIWGNACICGTSLGCICGVNWAEWILGGSTGDIAKFVEEFYDKGFFDYHPQRKHQHFHDFTSQMADKDATKCKAAFLKRSAAMDLYREALLLQLDGNTKVKCNSESGSLG